MKDLIEKFKGDFSIKTYGNSMTPLLQDGDIVSIEKIQFNKININDIVCFKSNEHLVTHRVVYKKKNYVITKGDNSFQSDGKIRPQHILGKVNSAKRGKKSIDLKSFYLLQSSFYFGEIKKIIDIFKKNRIDCVILKGLPLHLWLEGQYPSRVYIDCDILVAKKDVKKAIRCLKNEGYKPFNTSFTQKHREIKDKIVEEGFVKYVLGFPVIFDIHHEPAFLLTQIGKLEYLYPQALIDDFSSDLLSNKRVVEIEGENFPLLSIEHQIIYLFLHMFHHNFRGAYRYDLLSKFLKLSFNKNKLFTIIQKYKFSNYIYPGLILLNTYYPQKKVREILDSIKVSYAVKRFTKRYISNTLLFDEEEHVGGGIRRFWLIFWLSPRNIFIRFLTCFNRQVVYSLYWISLRKLRRLF